MARERKIDEAAPAEGPAMGGTLRVAMDAAQFARQFEMTFHTLWLIAAGIVNDRAIAEDVVQEAAITAMSKLNEFDPATNFTAWMARIVRYVALNQSRRGRHQPMSVDPSAMDDSHATRSGDDESAAARSGLPMVDSHGKLDSRRTPFDDRVMKALNSVNEVARACLLLRTLEGLSYDEIARALDIPPGTAMSHVFRARRQLREQLADLNPARSPASTVVGGGAT